VRLFLFDRRFIVDDMLRLCLLDLFLQTASILEGMPESQKRNSKAAQAEQGMGKETQAERTR